MCKVCEKLDLMIDCLESLHSSEELREVMMSVSDHECKDITDMTKDDIYIQTAIDLMIHWVDKYDADPFEVLSIATRRYGDRLKAQALSSDEDK